MAFRLIFRSDPRNWLRRRCGCTAGATPRSGPDRGDGPRRGPVLILRTLGLRSAAPPRPVPQALCRGVRGPRAGGSRGGLLTACRPPTSRGRRGSGGCGSMSTSGSSSRGAILSRSCRRRSTRGLAVPTRSPEWADVCTGSGCLAVLLAGHLQGGARGRDRTCRRARSRSRPSTSAGTAGRARPAGRERPALGGPAGLRLTSASALRALGARRALPREVRRERRLAWTRPDGSSSSAGSSANRAAPQAERDPHDRGRRGPRSFEREFGRLEPHWFTTETAATASA